MKLNTIIILTLFIITFLFTGCQDDAPELSKTELLQRNKRQFAMITSNEEKIDSLIKELENVKEQANQAKYDIEPIIEDVKKITERKNHSSIGAPKAPSRATKHKLRNEIKVLRRLMFEDGYSNSQIEEGVNKLVEAGSFSNCFFSEDAWLSGMAQRIMNDKKGQSSLDRAVDNMYKKMDDQ